MLARFFYLMLNCQCSLSLPIFILLPQHRINTQRDIVRECFIGKLVLNFCLGLVSTRWFESASGVKRRLVKSNQKLVT